MSMIELNHVSKTYKVANRSENAWKYLFAREYREIAAIKDLSLKIEEGEAVGLLGPNGAGKSTLVKMMVGILQPTSGEILVNGRIPFKKRKENAKNIGVVFGQRTQLWWDLPLEDTLKLHKEMYEIPDQVYNSNLDAFSELLGLKSFWTQPVRQLSLGQRMKADITAALLHNPSVLFLDEPTIGLDVVAKKQIRDFLKEINKNRGVTVILTTHDMKDVEEVCPRVVVVNKGGIVVDDSLAAIKAKVNQQQVSVVFEHPVEGHEEGLGYRLSRKEGTTYTYLVDSEKINFSDFLLTIGQNGAIANISIESVDIDEIIRNIYEQ